MDKSEGKDKFAKFIDDLTVNAAKVYNAGKIKIEISSLKKTYSENLDKMSRKLLTLLEENKIDKTLFEPEYTNLLTVKEKILALENDFTETKNNIHMPSFTDDKKEETENKANSDENK